MAVYDLRSMIARQETETYWNTYRKSVPDKNRVIAERIHHIMNTSLDTEDVYFKFSVTGIPYKRFYAEWTYKSTGRTIAFYDVSSDEKDGPDIVCLYAPYFDEDSFFSYHKSHSDDAGSYRDIEHVLLSNTESAIGLEQLWDEEKVDAFRDKWIGWYKAMKIIKELDVKYRDDTADDIAVIRKLQHDLEERNKIQFKKYQSIFNATQKGLS